MLNVESDGLKSLLIAAVDERRRWASAGNWEDLKS